MTPLSSIPRRVKICEVGPRDGLQNEASPASTADKIRYIDLLTGSGERLIETTSFVSPKAIPQMADAAEVMAGIERRDGVTYLVLTPNLRGLSRAVEAGARAGAVFTAATESFTKRNINMTIDESLATFGEVVRAAKGDGLWVRGYVSTAFGCPYEGKVAPDAVVRVVDALANMGCDEISIGDTIGVGTPNQVFEIVERVRAVAALEAGVAIFDASSGGLGGCPYAPGATGNVATEDVLYMLHGMGIETGIDIDRLRAASRFIDGVLAGRVVSRAVRALEAAAARSV